MSKTSLPFIGIDWGTSRFRLFTIDEAGETTLIKDSEDGIGRLERDDLAPFLVSMLKTLPPLPVVMSGMVGSTLGLVEVPYLDCPASSERLSNHLFELVLPECEAPLYVVPGVRWAGAVDEIDVMRGEEVQVIGWLSTGEEVQGTTTLCLPGTHSKWVEVMDKEIRSVTTALTGELFALLSSYSVLVQGAQIDSEEDFIAGIEASEGKSELLRQLFRTRSRVVAGGADSRYARSYLSGLLIGAELKSVKQSLGNETLHIIASDELGERYAVAANCLGMKAQIWQGKEMATQGLKEIWRCRGA